MKADKTVDNQDTMRLNRYLAHSGIAARRKADELIAEGLVKVNDEVVKEMGYRVKPGDVVKFKDKIVTPSKNFVYILLNKPKNVITTSEDEKGRKNVLHLVKKATEERVFPVGRLDKNTTGVLLITNDGPLANLLSHPSSEAIKVYHVVLDKPLEQKHFDEIVAGIVLEDGPIKVDEIAFQKGKDKTNVGVQLHSGRNRIVRRIFEHFDYKIEKLDRVVFAGLTKKDVPRGKYRLLDSTEVLLLKRIKEGK